MGQARAPFEALSRIYPGEYGATGEIEIRRVFEPEGLTHRIAVGRQSTSSKREDATLHCLLARTQSGGEQ